MFPSPLCTALHRSRAGTPGHRCNHSPGWPSLPGPQPLERHLLFWGWRWSLGPIQDHHFFEPLKHKPWQITELLRSLPPLDTACLWSPQHLPDSCAGCTQHPLPRAATCCSPNCHSLGITARPSRPALCSCQLERVLPRSVTPADGRGGGGRGASPRPH